MEKPDMAAVTPAADPQDATSNEGRRVPVPSGMGPAVMPYLLVAALGLLATLVVLAQLWAYRDELRTILTQTPV